MQKCKKCGGKIIFRTVDGRVKPIHLSGGCYGNYGRYSPGANVTKAPPRLAAPIGASLTSYLRPNAKCPVCGVQVFFFQSDNGGRVFFDDVGWPWPKHPCTDNRGTVFENTSTPTTANYDRSGLHKHEVFKLSQVSFESDRMTLSLDKPSVGLIGFLQRIFVSQELVFSFSVRKLKAANIAKADFEQAPSFLIAPSEIDKPMTIIEFVSIPSAKIVRLRMKRENR